MQIRIPKPGELRLIRQRSSEYAAEHISVEQAHAQFQQNGSIASINPFYKVRNSAKYSV